MNRYQLLKVYLAAVMLSPFVAVPMLRSCYPKYKGLSDREIETVEEIRQKHWKKPERVSAEAAKFEVWDWRVPVALYQSINDHNAARKTLLAAFRAGWVGTRTLESEFNVCPTMDDILERAISYSDCDDWGCSFFFARKYCRESPNRTGLSRLATSLETKAAAGDDLFKYVWPTAPEIMTEIASSCRQRVNQL